MHSRHAPRLRGTITPSSLPGPLMALVGGSCAPQLSYPHSQGQLRFSSDIPLCHVQHCQQFSKIIGVLHGLTHSSLDGRSLKRNPRAQDNSPTPHARPLYTSPKQPSCNGHVCTTMWFKRAHSVCLNTPPTMAVPTPPPQNLKL